MPIRKRTPVKKKRAVRRKSVEKAIEFPIPEAFDVQPVELQTITAQYSKIYGSEVVEDRAIPDFRDGLKPVHRASLWAMYVNRMHFNTKHKKSARIVGDVIGKFHPHGDTAAYGAMVTITNNVMPNLIDGKGNWGNHIDGPAHHRYCFVGNTRVMTAHGLINIVDIPKIANPDSKEHVHSDKYKVDLDIDVSSLNDPIPMSHWINSGYQDTVGIKTNLGNTIRCTPNQPVYILKGTEYVWVPVEELRLEDRICIKLENSLDTERSKPLPDFNYIRKSNAHTYPISYFPKTMSEELAFVLGALVAEGSCRGSSFGIGFNNTCRSYYNAFTTAWSKVFDPRIKTSEKLREPTGFGKKKCMYFNANYGIIGEWFVNVGIKWGSYNQIVPETIFKASRSEVRSFLSGLFEGDGSVAGEITLHSKSKKLLKDTQQLLLNYFAVYSIVRKDRLIINGHENALLFLESVPFVSEYKTNIANRKIDELKSIVSDIDYKYYGGHCNDSIPKTFTTSIRNEYLAFKISSKTYRKENGEEFTVHGSGFTTSPHQGCSELFKKIPTSRSMYRRHLLKYAEQARPYWPKLVDKMERILTDNYYYATVTEITQLDKAWVYDLTVPKTHAFIANGVVSHNTEARLSEFADKFLLDKDYLAVVPMVENYDGTEKWPLFLPALLPIQLLVGSPTVPAYGISAGTPSFHIGGVSKLVEFALKGKRITPKACLKYLELNTRYGGECISDDDTLLELYSTGKGSLKYIPEIDADENAKGLAIMSCSPGSFQAEKSITNSLAKIADLPGVTGVADASGRGAGAYGIKYSIKFKRMSEDAYDDTYEKIEKILSGSVSFHIGYTHRKKVDTTFGRMNIPDFIMTWTRYRIKLELAVIVHLIGVEQKKLERQELLLWGTDHIDDIAKALKDKKNGPKKRLMMLWKDKSEEFIIDILKLQVQQLATLERNSVLEKIKEIKSVIRGLKGDHKHPAERILRDFSTKVNSYIRKTDDRL